MSTLPISAIAAVAAPDATGPMAVALPPAAQTPGSFAQMLLGGVEQVDDQLNAADAAARAFAVDDSVPLHQVTFAIEQARLSFELMLQVRARLVEGYQEIMRMQL